MSRFIDIGANLTDPVFRGIYNHGEKRVHIDDLCVVLERAWNYGLEKIIITGSSLEDSINALNIAMDNCTTINPSPRLYSTVGCHPTRTSEWHKDTINTSNEYDSYLESLRRLLHDNLYGPHPLVVAIGECGLDYDRLEFSPKEIQKLYFEKQFGLAQEFQLPMFFHCRNAYSDFHEIVMRNRYTFSNGIVHSFTGTKEEAKSIIDELNLYIGLNGCSFKTKESLQIIRDYIPLDRILIETDAPWCEIRPTHAGHSLLSNLPYRPIDVVPKERYRSDALVKGRNEPCSIQKIAVAIASLKMVDISTVTRTIYNNTIKVFFNK